MRLIIREKEVMCPECYHWHEMYYQIDKDNQTQLVCLCPHKQKTKVSTVVLPFRKVSGLTELLSLFPEHVFIKKKFKIMRKTDWQQPRLF